MTDKHITIMVVDRSLKKVQEEKECDLYSAICTLREQGYTVITTPGPEGIRQTYDIMLLHPTWGDCEYFWECHRAYPSTPMILQSGRKLLDEMPGGIGKSYDKDAEGVYKNMTPTIEGLLELVNTLSTEILKRKSQRIKKSEEVIATF